MRVPSFRDEAAWSQCGGAQDRFAERLRETQAQPAEVPFQEPRSASPERSARSPDNPNIPPAGLQEPTGQSPERSNKMAVSTTAADGDIQASDGNQEALEGRFIALYEHLMEKQVSFKEAVEPFKTDNQNAAKG